MAGILSHPLRQLLCGSISVRAFRATSIGFLIAIGCLNSVSAQESRAPLTVAEQAHISDIMHRAIDAGRRETDRAQSNMRLSANDRRDAQSQFALMLMTAGQCSDATRYVSTHPEIMATGIERLIVRAQRDADRNCLTGLAEVMLERWNDPYLTPGGQIGLRFLAASYLDVAGRTGGREARDKAETDLLSLPGTAALWSARWKAITAYEQSAALLPYLDYLSKKMVTERLPFYSQERKSILVYFAGKDRCDLVEKVVKEGPTSCDQFKRMAEGIYINPQPPKNLAVMLRGIETPALEEASIQKALSKPTPWTRLTGLLLLVSACKDALASPIGSQS